MLIAISCWFGVKANGDNLLENDVARRGIVSLELAGSVNQAQLIINSWQYKVPERRSDDEVKKQGRIFRAFTNQGRMVTDVAKRSLIFDLFFISFYASAMAVACLLAATEIHCRSRKPKPRLVALGMRLALLQLATAAFDVAENFALWRMLSGSVRNPWPWIAYGFAAAKFTLLGVSIVYIFVAFGFWLVDHRRPSMRKTIAATT